MPHVNYGNVSIFKEEREKMKATIKKIAEKSGYSIATVSRALNEKPYLVKKETMKKILAVAKKYGYTKDLSAQALVKGKTKDIGLVIPAIFGSAFYNDFYIKLIAAVTEEASDRRYKLRVLFLSREADFSDVVKEAKSLNLAGLICTPIYYGDYRMVKKSIKGLSLPVVMLNEKMADKNICSVVLDDYKGGYDGAKYLIGMGHKKIAVIRGLWHDIEKRYEGYRKALEDSGIPIKEKYIPNGDVATAETGYKKTLSLLGKKDIPTAIFALDDEMAIGALRAVKEKGLRCPEDISILGFDGMDISKFAIPRITTMVRPVGEMGRKAVDILLRLGEGGRPDHVIVEASLEEGESCNKRK